MRETPADWEKERLVNTKPTAKKEDPFLDW
jgi:hypothetical protein